MCGIAGIAILNGSEQPVGALLLQMLNAIQHRGLDSAGLAIFSDHVKSGYRARILVEEEYADKLVEILRSTDARAVVEEHVRIDSNVILVVRIHRMPVRKLLKIAGSLGRVLSIEQSMKILKALGPACKLEELYRASKLKGIHGIGHVRFSTESAVDVAHAHPFALPDFPDVAVVHNGQITNYWKMRERLEAKGHVFVTENDSELIVHYIVDKLRSGYSLDEALKSSVRELDGPFAYIIATADEVGMARDKLGLRPLVVGYGDELVLAASEEAAIRAVEPDARIEHVKPGEVVVWKVRR